MWHYIVLSSAKVSNEKKKLEGELRRWSCTCRKKAREERKKNIKLRQTTSQAFMLLFPSSLTIFRLLLDIFVFDNFVMLTGRNKRLTASISEFIPMSPDGASAMMQTSPPLSPSSPPVIPASRACPVRLNKQIGHFTGTVAVIGKMCFCLENIWPGHGSQTGWLNDISNVYSAGTCFAGPASSSGVTLHTWTLSEVLWIHLVGRLNSYCDYCGVIRLWDIKSKSTKKCIW